MKRFTWLVLAVACSGSTEPAKPLDVALLTGTYSVALRSTSSLNSGNSCPSLSLDFDAGTFACASGAWAGVTGSMSWGGEQVQLFQGLSEEWTFYDLTGSANAPRGQWTGPCTGGGPLGCYHESGRATFSRP